MLLKNYKNKYKKLNIKKSQIIKISDFIEDEMFKMKSNGWIDTFNDLYWYIIGEADYKDIFSKEEDINVSVLSIKSIEIEDLKLNLIKKFVSFIKETLDDIQYKEFQKSMKELYVAEKEYIEKEYYLEFNYSTDKISTKYHLLKELMK